VGCTKPRLLPKPTLSGSGSTTFTLLLLTMVQCAPSMILHF